ncbi:MAG: class I SAM-dependent methyltransferase [Acidobacteria bacterium]|nr:class I SAM-dependent methyltransferase [Acidobacteriota bacterium]
MNVDDKTLLMCLSELSRRAPGDGSYVALQDIPFRGHHLLARAVLGATPEAGTVFEGGVSSGYFAEVLTNYGLTVDGFELDPVAATEAKKVCRAVHTGDLNTFDIEGELRDGEYDTIVFGDTLEHLPDPVEVLSRLRPKLTEGGHLVLSVPNIANWSIRAQLLSGRFDYRDRGILDRTHLRFFTEKTLRSMLDDARFNVVDLVGSIPVPAMRSRRACGVAHRLGNLRPQLMAYTFIVTATPH